MTKYMDNGNKKMGTVHHREIKNKTMCTVQYQVNSKLTAK
jgi:spore coat protein U-like protein